MTIVAVLIVRAERPAIELYELRGVMQTPLSLLSLLLNAPESEQDNCLIMAIIILRHCYFGSDQMRTHIIMNRKWKIKFSIQFAEGFNFLNCVSFSTRHTRQRNVWGAWIKGNEQIIKIISIIIIINYCRMVVYYAHISSH